MKVDLSIFIECSPQEAIEQVKKPHLLFYIARPLVSFIPREPEHLPEIWTEGTYWFSLYLFGFIPIGRQAVVISYPDTDGFCLRDNGHSALIKKWDHLIAIEDCKGGALYRDRLDLDAGILTPFVWLFAQAFYRYRQRRWKHLAKNGFDQLSN